ncbi:MAG TPA: sigma-70 family RNA polymerase sigma factor [Acidimicrobiales bacterium]|nr:sigma-70 family RNA polymerase sigma factor [Acidimicrobiales bacterium]
MTLSPDTMAVEARLEPFRPALTRYCYRMLGSAFEADDAVQETFVRAWRGLDRFEGRAPLEAWLYRIATNVCLTMLQGRRRRAEPMDLGPASPGGAGAAGRPAGVRWVEPFPDGGPSAGVGAAPGSAVASASVEPGDAVVERESIRLAFVAALQHLPPRQRAVLILRDVLRWRAQEVADLLDTSVVSVKSSLQRARATLAARGVAGSGPGGPRRGPGPGAAEGTGDPAALAEDQARLLDRYLDAFRRYDVDALVALLHEDATLSMPPADLWFRGRSDIRVWLGSEGAACAGSLVVPTWANGSPAFAQYRPGPGGYEAFALQVIDVEDGQVRAIRAFVEPRLFPLFGLPLVAA